MCGIFGIINRNGLSGGDRDLVRRLAAALVHRGPDGERPAAAEDLPYLVGPGRRRHVVVGRNSAQKLVANAATCPNSLMASLPQPADDIDGKPPR